jgi:hypothetical protein
MKYIDYNETNPKLSIFAPIFHDDNCKVKKYFEFSRDGQIWKKHIAEEQIFSIKYKDHRKYEIKVRQEKYFQLTDCRVDKIFKKIEIVQYIRSEIVRQ